MAACGNWLRCLGIYSTSAEMKKIGSRMKERTGDYVRTFEVIGHVNGHEVWQQIKEEYNPISIDYLSLAPKRFDV